MGKSMAVIVVLLAGSAARPAQEPEANPAAIQLGAFKSIDGAESAFSENLTFATNGTAEATVKIPSEGEYRIQLSASGTAAKEEHARLKVQVDGKDLSADATSTSDEAASHEFPATLAAGERKIGIRFVNDFADETAEQNRDLYVYSVQILDKDGKAISVALPSFQPVGEFEFAYSAYLTVSTNGTVEAPVRLSAEADYEIRVSAAGTSAKDECARFKIRVDGQEAGETILSKEEGAEHVVALKLAAGDHKVALQLVNDLVDEDAGTNRELYVYAVLVNDKSREPVAFDLRNLSAVGDVQISSQGVVVSTNGVVESEINIPAEAEYKIQASISGTTALSQYASWQFTVDGKASGEIFFTTDEAEARSVTHTLTAGLHKIGIRFLNDADDPDEGTTRDLYVYAIEVYDAGENLVGGDLKKFEPNEAQISWTGLTISTNGAVRTGTHVPGTGEFEVKVTAAGTTAKDECAKFVVQVDGQDVGQPVLVTEEAAEHTVKVNLTYGVHSIGIRFINDLDDPDNGTNRDLYLYAVQIQRVN